MTLQKKLDLLKDLLLLGRITAAEYDVARMSVLDGETTVELLGRFTKPHDGSSEPGKPQ
jgi:hypothetical protein